MPGPFQFALSPVLQLRERAVEAAREALGRAVRARADADAALAQAEAAFADRLGADAPSSRTAGQLGGAAAHRGGLARAAAAARQTAERRRAEEQRARRALADAMREREALTILRTEAADAHQTHVLRVEVAALDDLATAGRAARALAMPSQS